MHLGRYALLRKIAEGGAGIVFEGVAPDGQRVALKLRKGLDAADAARFERERQLLASLGETSGFVPLLDAGDSPEGPWLALPLLTGGTLRDRLRGAGRLPLEEALLLGRQLATALGQAHERGIVHRDLKPDNVLFTGDGHPLVGDLGLGKHLLASPGEKAAAVSVTRADSFAGTTGYAAPEQLDDARRVGPEADVFALGALIYECLTGSLPYDASGVLTYVKELERGHPPSLREQGVAAPAWLEDVLWRALDPDPAQRFADGRALALALEAPRSRWRVTARAAAGVLVALACVATGAWLALARGRPHEVEPPRPVASPSAAPRSPLAEAETAFAHGHFLETRDVVTRLLARTPGDVAALLLRARANHELGARPEELADYSAAFAVRPFNRELCRQAVVGLHDRLLSLPMLDRQLAFVVIAGWASDLEAVPDDAEASFQRGYAYAWTGDWANARVDISRACDEAPTNANWIAHRGWTALMNWQLAPEVAIPDFDRALELDPRSALAYRWRGEARWKRGEREAAIADWRQGLVVAPDEASPVRRLLIADLHAAGVIVPPGR